MKIRSKATLTLRAMLARRYGFGASPNKQRPGLCGHGGIACHLATPSKMAQKNGGTRFFYASSVSLAAFIAWIVASTIFNSFSSRALSMASIRFLHSLPLFLDG